MRAIVMTGASSGIGAACAVALAKRGFHVFAGVRKDADSDQLVAAGMGGRLVPLRLDVTDAESIRAATATVAAAVADAGIFGLFNNAGIAVSGPLEFTPLDRLRWQHEVNVIGPIALTQALLPLVRRGRGRIVFTSSSSGYLSAPFVGPYSASKFALEAAIDALRRELRPAGIPVVSVQPGAIKTPMWDKAKADGDRAMTELPEAAKAIYGPAVARMRAFADRRSSRAAPVELVVTAVLDAFERPRPKTHYRVGLDAKGQYLLSRFVPPRLVDWILDRALGG